MTYDAESRQTGVSGTGVNETYVYDGDGRRVGKVSSAAGTPTTVFVYDAMGRMAAEYSSVTDTPSCVTCYMSPDQLGTARLITDQNGSVVARHDYLPFGEEVGANAGRGSQWGLGNDSINQKFTGKERDAESGLDYFGARYYGSALGRFTVPDEPFADQEPDDPQSWNLYAYVRNGPLTSADPTGREEKHCDSDGNNCKFETTVTDTAVQILFAPMIAMNRTVEQTQQALQHVADWASQPRNPVCTAGYTGIGASIGFWAGGGLGSLGLAGGPAAVATIPGGAAGGAALGGAIGGFGGLVLCSTGSGSGSGGGGTSGGETPLRKLHNDRTVSKTSLEFWRKKSTQEIVDSLRPGSPEALRVKADGTIMNGNARITALQERGFDVNSLPRELH